MVCGAVFVLLPRAPQMLGKEGDRVRKEYTEALMYQNILFPNLGSRCVGVCLVTFL